MGVVDFAPFMPALGRPIALTGAAIFDGAEQIGILFIQFPLDEINRVMTGDGNWERDGLGRTGEVYLVGQDLLMRSDPAHSPRTRLGSSANWQPQAIGRTRSNGCGGRGARRSPNARTPRACNKV